MTDYIEREATVELLRGLGSRDYRREKGTIQDAIKMIQSTAYTPSADVVPVVHGRDVYDTHDGHCEFKCSICGVYVGVVEGGALDGGRFNFCPNCGAKMESAE